MGVQIPSGHLFYVLPGVQCQLSCVRSMRGLGKAAPKLRSVGHRPVPHKRTCARGHVQSAAVDTVGLQFTAAVVGREGGV